jgi:hypothetical protein
MASTVVFFQPFTRTFVATAVFSIRSLIVFPSEFGRPLTGRLLRLWVVRVTGFLLAGAAFDTRNVRRNTPPTRGPQGPITGPKRGPVVAVGLHIDGLSLWAQLYDPPHRHPSSPHP